MTSAIDLIAHEFNRSRTEEGYTAEHDLEHQDESLALAACSYAIPATWRRYKKVGEGSVPTTWPWAPEYWKPTWLQDMVDTDSPLNVDGRIRDLTKAGALIASEITRLQSLK